MKKYELICTNDEHTFTISYFTTDSIEETSLDLVGSEVTWQVITENGDELTMRGTVTKVVAISDSDSDGMEI